MFFNEGYTAESHGVGDIGYAEFINVQKPPHIVFPKVALSVAAIIAIYFFAFTQDYVPVNTRTITLVTVGIVGYLAIAWFIRPEPNMKNLGVAGTCIDNRWTLDDDKNRWLLHAKMLLAPGVFAVQSFVELSTLFGVVPERTKETIKEEWAAEAASRKPTEDRDGGGSIELSSAKYFQSQSQEQEVGSPS